MRRSSPDAGAGTPGCGTDAPGARTARRQPPARCSQPEAMGQAGARRRRQGEGRPEEARERRRGPQASRSARLPPTNPVPVLPPFLTSRKAAGLAGANAAAGLRSQKAPPHRGRVGRGHVRPPSPLPPARLAAETCVEPGPRPRPQEGRRLNGCSATAEERRGQIGRSGGGCHGPAGFKAEARAGEAAAPP